MDTQVILIIENFIEILVMMLDYEYIKPYIAANGARVHTGIKYYRITGKD